MLKKQNILDLLKGDFTPLTESINEKVETVVADMVVDLSEALLSEMTPGHKAMMKQHLDNVDVEDDTDELDGSVTKPKKRKDARIKNPKRPDDRDDYNQLNDFAASKSPKNTNFVGKTYTTNERALRSEAVEPLEELSQEKLAKYKDHAGAQILKYDGKSHNKDKKFWNRVKGLNTLGRKTKSVKEEVEPLEELSKATLGSYAKKASSRAVFHQAKSIEALGDKNYERAGHHGVKSAKRLHGTKMAIDKLQKEEIEPLEELSKATLGSYVKKASHDVATKSAGVGRYSERSHKNLETYKSGKGDVEDRNTAYRSASKEDALADRLFKKSWKRREGMAKAVDKITKD